MATPQNSDVILLDAFRFNYHQIEGKVVQALGMPTDTIVLERLMDDLKEFSSLVEEHAAIFPLEEINVLNANIALMTQDLQLQHRDVLDQSHQGRPSVLRTVRTGNRGRPRIEIDPDFLAWAITQRTTSGVARFLGVDRSVVRSALLQHGLATPGTNPFPSEDMVVAEDERRSDPMESDDILEPPLPTPPDHFHDTEPRETFNDLDLDALLLRLRSHYPRAGLGMLDGMLRRLGYHVSRERLREALLRIDPIRRVFERIRIRRRKYSVPGPNALWHHDGQHGELFEYQHGNLLKVFSAGLIRWGIVIHGFIDGYSRLITGLKASNNNTAETVLNLFMEASQTFGVPSRLRGDHGTENLLVAAWMEEHVGAGRGSYIWGRSVHNIRIERLWVDVTAQVTSSWADLFIHLELHYGLNINNQSHIWLLHSLFLPLLNSSLRFFAESWNQHKIQIRDGPNRSPADMWGFDSLVYGVRDHSTPLSPADALSQEELEVYGIDWEGLREDALVESVRRSSPPQDGATSWINQAGPPQNLNHIQVPLPNCPLTQEQIEVIEQIIEPWLSQTNESHHGLVNAWYYALANAKQMDPDHF